MTNSHEKCVACGCLAGLVKFFHLDQFELCAKYKQFFVVIAVVDVVVVHSFDGKPSFVRLGRFSSFFIFILRVFAIHRSTIYVFIYILITPFGSVEVRFSST